jgi:L-2-hydroxyglutarate oxidase LhgO
MTDVDVAVLGAGVVGLAIAGELGASRKVRLPASSAIPAPGMDTSTHNSGVIHAGILLSAGILEGQAVRGTAAIGCMHSARSTRCRTRAAAS